jgi:hypothetical protein
MPYIFPKKALDQVQLTITDDDDQCKSQISIAKSLDILKNASERNCGWHKFDRNFRVKVVKHCESAHDHFVLKIIVKWLFSICKTLESQHEVVTSKNLMFQWLSTSACARALIVATETFWKEKLENQLNEFVHYKFMETYGGWVCTTSFQESENSTLKRDTMGPKPNMSIDRAVTAITRHEGRRTTKLSQDHHQALMKTTVTYEDETFQTLSKHWQPRIVSETKLQFDQKDNYRHYQFGENEYYVKRETWTGIDHHKWMEERYHERVVPSFWRTRIVRVINDEIMCSCSLYAAKGYPCRHIWCILSSLPMPNDVFYKHLKSFATYYGVNEQFTRYCDQINISKGPKMLPSRIMDTSRAYDNADWFRCTLTIETPVLRPGSVHEEEEYFSAVMELEGDNDDDNNLLVGFGGMQNFGQMSEYAKAALDTPNNEEEKYPGDVFSVLKPKFDLATKNVKTRKEFQILSDGMDKVLEELLSQKQGTNSKGKMVSMPALDHRRKDKRKKPAGELFMSNTKKK